MFHISYILAYICHYLFSIYRSGAFDYRICALVERLAEELGNKMHKQLVEFNFIGIVSAFIGCCLCGVINVVPATLGLLIRISTTTEVRCGGLQVEPQYVLCMTEEGQAKEMLGKTQKPDPIWLQLDSNRHNNVTLQVSGLKIFGLRTVDGVVSE
jgi:hypothetical protein